MRGLGGKLLVGAATAAFCGLFASACGYDSKPINRPAGTNEPLTFIPIPGGGVPGGGAVIPPPGGRGGTHPSRSQLSPLHCPWGVEQSAGAAAIREANIELERTWACDHVLYNEDLFGAVTPGFPTFDEVKANYDALVAAIGMNRDLLELLKRGKRLRKIVFVTKADASEISFAEGELRLSLYGRIDAPGMASTFRAILAANDNSYDGLPVIPKQGRRSIDGSAEQRSRILRALTQFEPIFREYREDLLLSRRAIHEIELGESPAHDALPLYRAGVLRIPLRDRRDIAWAYEDAIAVTRSYAVLPDEFRDKVAIRIDLPESSLPELTRPEKDHAKAIELLGRNVNLLQTLAFNLESLSLVTCAVLPMVGNPAGCAWSNARRTEIRLGMFARDGIRDLKVVSAAAVEDQIRRLFGVN